MNRLAAIALLAIATSVGAQNGLSKGGTGQPAVDSASRKSSDGFTGSVVVTPDDDWKARWDAAPGTAPALSEAKAVPKGKRIYVLIFFANPKPDAKGSAEVVCDLKLSGPNQTVVVDRKGVGCFNGRMAGDPQLVRIAAPIIAFVGKPADPSGEWVVEVLLRDKVRGTELPLRASFMLQ